jgi:PIN domain nuclease of toxin-antitoxin system
LKLLVDTHCWLWYLLSPEKLNSSARELLQDREHDFYLSTASAWEIVIKYDLGKLEIPLKPTEYIPKRLAILDHFSLPITLAHVLEVEKLPRHHKDPFDRILVAQARVDSLKLITADDILRRYDVPLVWAGHEHSEPNGGEPSSADPKP